MKFKTLASFLLLLPALTTAQDSPAIDPAIIPPDVVKNAIALRFCLGVSLMPASSRRLYNAFSISRRCARFLD